MDTIRNLFSIFFNLEPATQDKILGTILVFIVLWTLRLLLRRLIRERLQASSVRVRYNWRKTADYTVMVLGIFFIGRIWIEGIQSLATYLGLLSAGLAIALQDLIINLVGWGFILWRRPFTVSDRIQIGEHVGDVIDIRFFEFSLLEIGNWVGAGPKHWSYYSPPQRRHLPRTTLQLQPRPTLHLERNPRPYHLRKRLGKSQKHLTPDCHHPCPQNKSPRTSRRPTLRHRLRNPNPHRLHQRCFQRSPAHPTLHGQPPPAPQLRTNHLGSHPTCLRPPCRHRPRLRNHPRIPPLPRRQKASYPTPARNNHPSRYLRRLIHHNHNSQLANILNAFRKSSIKCFNALSSFCALYKSITEAISNPNSAPPSGNA